MIFDGPLPRDRFHEAGEGICVDARRAALQFALRGREISRLLRGALRDEIVEPTLQPTEHDGDRQPLQRFGAGECVAFGARRQLLEREVSQRPALVGSQRQCGQRRTAGLGQQPGRIGHALFRKPRPRLLG